MNMRKNPTNTPDEHSRIRGFRDLLLRILDRLSAFCNGMIVEPILLRPTRLLSVCFIALALLWSSAADVEDGDPFPALRAADLPVLARGISEKSIVLDRSLCDLSKFGGNQPDLLIDQVTRLNERDHLLGEWL